MVNEKSHKYKFAINTNTRVRACIIERRVFCRSDEDKFVRSQQDRKLTKRGQIIVVPFRSIVFFFFYRTSVLRHEGTFERRCVFFPPNFTRAARASAESGSSFCFVFRKCSWSPLPSPSSHTHKWHRVRVLRTRAAFLLPDPLSFSYIRASLESLAASRVSPPRRSFNVEPVRDCLYKAFNILP